MKNKEDVGSQRSEVRGQMSDVGGKSTTKCQTQKGITLIALIITVIILLILAGTAISISINGGDLFGKSQNAVTQYNNRVAEEENAINEVWNILNKRNEINDSVGIIVNHNGTEIDISKIPANTISDYYGDYVVNYTKGGTYQLYYVDNAGQFGDVGRIYIQNIAYSRKNMRFI